jgi:hypothetical protein
MPNQTNFRSDITTKTDIRFLASRVVNNPSELILFEEIPASFGYDNNDNVELHFYSLITNVLVLSITVKLSDDVLKVHTVKYADNTYKNYLRIDFTKLFIDKNIILVSGDYRVAINFFADEIGTYENKILNIDVISDSRTEVQLSFNNSIDAPAIRSNNVLAKEFVEKAFNKIDAAGVAEKIFKSGVQLNDSTEGVTARNIIERIEVVDQTYEQTIGKIDRLGILSEFENDLNEFVMNLYQYVVEEIIIKGDERIQEDEYRNIIEKVVNEKINTFSNSADRRIQVS